MATCQAVATKALLKLQAVALGETPDAASLEHAMGQLQSSLLGLLSGTLGRLYDVAVTKDATAYPGLRIRVDAAGVTITNPLILPYWWCGWGPGYNSVWGDMPWLWWGTLNQTDETLPPKNMACAVVIDFDGTEHVWVYNAYAGKWVDLYDLQPSDPFPLAQQYENGFSAMVALDMVDIFNEQSQTTIASLTDQARRGKMMLAHKYDNRPEPAGADYF